jgi:AmmeMemoRadiSam system protein A
MSVPRSADSAATLARELLHDDRVALLALARHAIRGGLGLVAPAPAQRPVFDRICGAFVTVHVDGALRGCIGMPEASQPLREVVLHCANAAAFEDPRFPAIEAQEIDRLAIEISVLSPRAPLRDPSELEVGRHGLVIEQGMRRGLLLPQVATEHGWTATDFLRHTCRKADLPLDAWHKGATLWTFEAVVFSERTETGG